MPMYEYYCDKCEREVQLTLTIREHDKGPIKCPKCGGKALRDASSQPLDLPDSTLPELLARELDR